MKKGVIKHYGESEDGPSGYAIGEGDATDILRAAAKQHLSLRYIRYCQAKKRERFRERSLKPGYLKAGAEGVVAEPHYGIAGTLTSGPTGDQPPQEQERHRRHASRRSAEDGRDDRKYAEAKPRERENRTEGG